MAESARSDLVRVGFIPSSDHSGAFLGSALPWKDPSGIHWIQRPVVLNQFKGSFTMQSDIQNEMRHPYGVFVKKII